MVALLFYTVNMIKAEYGIVGMLIKVATGILLKSVFNT